MILHKKCWLILSRSYDLPLAQQFGRHTLYHHNICKGCIIWLHLWPSSVAEDPSTGLCLDQKTRTHVDDHGCVVFKKSLKPKKHRCFHAFPTKTNIFLQRRLDIYWDGFGECPSHDVGECCWGIPPTTGPM